MEQALASDRPLVVLLRSLCLSTPLPTHSSACATEWEEFCEVATRHGLAGLLHALQPLNSQLSGESRAALKSSYRQVFLANILALDQLTAIVRAFNQDGIPVLVLKGCSALLFLYDSIAWREIGDIDLLIREQDVPAGQTIMTSLGYRSAVTTSPEEDYIDFHQRHLEPYRKDGHFSVELHGTILYGRGRARLASVELWEQSVTSYCGGTAIRYPCPEHFLIHAAVHAMKHVPLHDNYPFALKSIADAILVWKKFGEQIVWPEFWRTAARWGVESDVATVVATIRRHWGIAIPLPESRAAETVPMNILVDGPGRPPAWERATGGYRRHFNQGRELPTIRHRLRYWFRLVFPVPAMLRERYQVPEAKSVLPYYGVRLVDIFRRICQCSSARR